jgi:dihydropyrimidine dehydrogenase (NAD+) subunit PreA
MQYGYRIVEDLEDGLRRYMHKRGVTSVADLIGCALPKIVEPTQLDSSTEVVSIIDPVRCVGCGLCVIACADGAAQAIHMESVPAPHDSGLSSSPLYRRIAIVDSIRCIGCGMCKHTCPVDDAVELRVRTRINHPI